MEFPYNREDNSSQRHDRLPTKKPSARNGLLLWHCGSVGFQRPPALLAIVTAPELSGKTVLTRSPYN